MSPLAACLEIGSDLRFDVQCHTSSSIDTIERGMWLLARAEPATYFLLTGRRHCIHGETLLAALASCRGSKRPRRT